MTVLVTGATGFIGSQVVRQLSDRGEPVRCLVRAGSRTDRLDGLPVERAIGDLADADSLRRAASGCAACIHLAAVSGWASHQTTDFDDVIVGGTARLLQALRQAGVRRMVYVSSAAAIGGTPTPIPLDEQSPFTLAGENLPYAWAKHRAEALVLSAADADFAVVVVNPAEVYGADDRDWITAGAIRDILRGWPAVAVRGGTSVVHVTDVATGIVAALAQGRSGERYILGGDNLSFAELVRLVLELAALRRPVVTLPFWLLRAAVRASLALGLPPPVEPGLLGYLDRYWFMDSAKARRELGFRPRPARAVLEPVVRWVGEQDRVAAQQRWVTRTTGATG